MCRAFPYQPDWLPIQEKVVSAAQGLSDNYPLLVRLAEWLALVHYYLKNHPNSLPDDASFNQANNKLFAIHSNIANGDWSKQHDCSEVHKAAFIQRMTNISKLLTASRANFNEQDPLHYLLYAMRLLGDFDKYQSELLKKYASVNTDQIMELFSQQDPLRFTIMQSFSLLWWFIDQQAEQLKFFLQPALLQENSDKFRRQRELLGKTEMQSWLKRNDLDLPGYQKFITAVTRLKLIQNQPDILNIHYEEEDIFWLYEALCLTDGYQAAKGLC